MRKRKKALIHPAVKAIFLVAVALLAVKVVSLQLQITDLRAQSTSLQREVERKQQENEEFKDSLEEGDTDESIAKIARDVLGYASPGERVYVDSSEH